MKKIYPLYNHWILEEYKQILHLNNYTVIFLMVMCRYFYLILSGRNVRTIKRYLFMGRIEMSPKQDTQSLIGEIKFPWVLQTAKMNDCPSQYEQNYQERLSDWSGLKPRTDIFFHSIIQIWKAITYNKVQSELIYLT